MKYGRIESRVGKQLSRQGWAVADREAEPREENVECRSDTGPCSADIPTSLPLEPPVSTALTAPTSPALGGEN